MSKLIFKGVTTFIFPSFNYITRKQKTSKINTNRMFTVILDYGGVTKRGRLTQAKIKGKMRLPRFSIDKLNLSTTTKTKVFNILYIWLVIDT